MAKKLKIYFKNRTSRTLQRLDKYPKSYSLILGNWNAIIKSLIHSNKPKDPFKKAVVMDCQMPRYIALLKDLKINQNSKQVSFYLDTTHQRFLVLQPITVKKLSIKKNYNKLKRMLIGIIIMVIMLIIYLYERGMG